MKTEQTECSETSAHKIQAPMIYPEEIIQPEFWSTPPTLSHHVSFQTPLEFQQIRLGPNEFISITPLVSAHELGRKFLLSELESMLLHIVSLDQLRNDPISRWLKRLEREPNDIRIQYLILRICGALPPALLVNLWPKLKCYLGFCWWNLCGSDCWVIADCS